MQNITREYYKKAIREKYEKEKNGDNSYYLEVPSQAKLRDLCWKIFMLNGRKDDLNTFYLFFKSEFDSTQEAAFNQYLDKFRSIGSFLTGKKEPANFHAVELASILVDFELRPYAKFRKYYSEDKKDLGGKDDLVSIDTVMEPGIEFAEITENLDEDKSFEVRASSFVSTNKNNFFERLFKKSKPTIKVMTIIFCLIAGVIYFAFFKTECMQWSIDHYEKVRCDLEMGLKGNYNKIEPFDETAFNLKKITICDTTTCFDNNGVPIIWYAKVGDSVEFFNTHGMHPEKKKPLKPVTQYIIDKYVK